MMKFRKANLVDLERVIEIHTNAYADHRGYEVRKSHLTRNQWGQFQDLYVVEENHQIVAHAFLYPMHVRLGNEWIPAGGIASVGVAPEARGCGFASKLLDHLHSEAQLRGDVLTLLFPFRRGFYARLGYAPTPETKRLMFAPESIPASWVPRTSGKIVRPASGQDRNKLIQYYERAACNYSGWIKRTFQYWEMNWSKEKNLYFILEDGTNVQGYIRWSLSQLDPSSITRLTVHEIVAETYLARRLLLGFARTQKEQVRDISIQLDSSDPLNLALQDAERTRSGVRDIEDSLGELTAGPMVRLTDIHRSIQARRYMVDGLLSLQIEGDEDSLQRIDIQVTNGQAKLTSCDPKGSIRLSRAALGAVLYGAVSPSAAARVGWLQADSPATLELCDAMFYVPPYLALDSF